MTENVWDGTLSGHEVLRVTADDVGLMGPVEDNLVYPTPSTEWNLVTTKIEPLQEVMRVNSKECLFMVNGEVVGTFSFGPPFHFAGNVDESAAIFVAAIKTLSGWCPALTVASAASQETA